jgi:hypothetical protein
MENQTMNRITFSVASLSFMTAVVWACNVPVFRYALERWPADLYEVVVLHDGQLTAKDQQLVAMLQESSRSTQGLTNYNLHQIAVSDVEDDLLHQVWAKHGTDSGPVLALLYPRNAMDVPDRVVTAAPLSQDAVEGLIDSPLRQNLVGEILAGESAVWLFVPSGNVEADQAALTQLHDHVARNERELELPPQDEIEADEFFRIENPIELRLGFSVLTLNRDDAKEKFLLAMLLGSEPDLESLQEPMAFPVIGRGRVLYGLVGKGISADTIKSASRFVVGPCSCQVKEQNPGFDLLLSVAWDDKLGGAILSEPALETERSAEPVLIDIPPGR